MAIGIALVYFVLGQTLDESVRALGIDESVQKPVVEEATRIAKGEVESIIDEARKNAIDAAYKATNKFLIDNFKSVSSELFSEQINALKNEQAEQILERVRLPAGAVLAFDDLVACPRGWEDYEPAFGRTIVGAGEGENLTPRGVNETGGTELHSHNGGTAGAQGGRGADNGGDFSASQPGHGHSFQTSVTTNMQPFLVLRYCIKT